MKLTPATSAAAIAVIGITGFAIGRISSSAPDANSGMETSGGREIRSRVSSRGEGPGSPVSRSGRSSSRADAAATASSADSKKQLEAIVRGENALDRNRALLAYIDRLGPGEFADAVAHFRSLGITESRMGEYSLLLTAWAETDPTAALAYAKDNTSGNFASNTILTTWAGRDPEAAVAWAKANHTGDGANPYMAGIIRGLATDDPVRATQLLTDMPYSRERGDALGAIMPALIQQGPDAARQWVSGISDERLRDGAMTRIAEQLANVDPKGTAEWLVANPSSATSRRLDDVLAAWARKDQTAAVSYLNTLPAGADRSNALRGVVTAVATEDPRAGAAMLSRYSGDVTDGVVQSFVWHAVGSDPVLAANHIGMIGDANQRDEMYRRALSGWLQRDPATAWNWIRSNNLPEEVRNHVTRQYEESQRRQ